MGIENILIVEDNKETMKRFKDFLRVLGFAGTIEYASSVGEMEGKKPAGLYFIDGLNGEWPKAVEIAKEQNPKAKIVFASAEPKLYIEAAEKMGIKCQDKYNLLMIVKEAISS